MMNIDYVMSEIDARMLAGLLSECISVADGSYYKRQNSKPVIVIR